MEKKYDFGEVTIVDKNDSFNGLQFGEKEQKGKKKEFQKRENHKIDSLEKSKEAIIKLNDWLRRDGKTYDEKGRITRLQEGNIVITWNGNKKCDIYCGNNAKGEYEYKYTLDLKNEKYKENKYNNFVNIRGNKKKKMEVLHENIDVNNVEELKDELETAKNVELNSKNVSKKITVSVIGKEKNKSMTIKGQIQNEELKIENLEKLKSILESKQIDLSYVDEIFIKNESDLFFKFQNGKIYRLNGQDLVKEKNINSVKDINNSLVKTSVKINYNFETKESDVGELEREIGSLTSFKTKLDELSKTNKNNKEQYKKLEDMVKKNENDLKSSEKEIKKLEKKLKNAEHEAEDAIKREKNAEKKLDSSKKMRVVQYVLKNAIKLKILKGEKIWHPKRSMDKERMKISMQRSRKEEDYHMIEYNYQIETKKKELLEQFKEDLGNCVSAAKEKRDKVKDNIKKTKNGLENIKKIEDYESIKNSVPGVEGDDVQRDVVELFNKCSEQKKKVLDSDFKLQYSKYSANVMNMENYEKQLKNSVSALLNEIENSVKEVEVNEVSQEEKKDLNRINSKETLVEENVYEVENNPIQKEEKSSSTLNLKGINENLNNAESIIDSAPGNGGTVPPPPPPPPVKGVEQPAPVKGTVPPPPPPPPVGNVPPVKEQESSIMTSIKRTSKDLEKVKVETISAEDLINQANNLRKSVSKEDMEKEIEEYLKSIPDLEDSKSELIINMEGRYAKNDSYDGMLPKESAIQELDDGDLKKIYTMINDEIENCEEELKKNEEIDEEDEEIDKEDMNEYLKKLKNVKKDIKKVISGRINDKQTNLEKSNESREKLSKSRDKSNKSMSDLTK